MRKSYFIHSMLNRNMGTNSGESESVRDSKSLRHKVEWREGLTANVEIVANGGVLSHRMVRNTFVPSGVISVYCGKVQETFFSGDNRRISSICVKNNNKESEKCNNPPT
jgi:hypothetical protein